MQNPGVIFDVGTEMLGRCRGVSLNDSQPSSVEAVFAAIHSRVVTDIRGLSSVQYMDILILLQIKL